MKNTKKLIQAKNGWLELLSISRCELSEKRAKNDDN